METWKTIEISFGIFYGTFSLQGMDPMVRQVWQHMEFEPEWESAFNLHLKLSTIVPLVVEWAASDLVVLIKSYRFATKMDCIFIVNISNINLLTFLIDNSL